MCLGTPASRQARKAWHQFRSWLVGQPLDSELHAAWEAINELLRGKLLAAGLLGLFFLACWRVVFRLGDHNPDHQDVEADYDVYAAGDRQQLPQHGRRSSRQRRSRLLAVQPRVKRAS
jgi:hypothetical protein